MNNDNHCFVYAVCGDDIFINQLNTSLNFLKHFTSKQIIIVTDLSRNKQKINHDNIIDIKTPDYFNSHQAAIYLKTSLNKHLPKGNRYCYLDSDILALSEKADKIFDFYKPPVCFAKDHIKTVKFSPYAVNCGCLEEYSIKKSDYLKKINAKHTFDDLFYNDDSREILKIIMLTKKYPAKNISIIIKYLVQYKLPFSRKFKLSDNYYLDKNLNTWFDKSHNTIAFDFFPFFKKYDLKCTHLHNEVKSKFGLKIPVNWQHWNGGVFLFDDNSDAFMNTWHEMTMEIFNDNKWKIRDQGTLIATAWKYKLQNHNTLPRYFNFIVDFFNPLCDYHSDKGFSCNGFKTTYNPAFIHYIHQFENLYWNVRQAADLIIKKLKEN
ncbi:MAG: hypothetical protein Kow0068_03350 [Marinilabiliales bacterium]